MRISFDVNRENNINRVAKKQNFSSVSFKAINPSLHFDVFIQNATSYQPQYKTFMNYCIPVHNKKIMMYMKDNYNLNDFERLFDFAKRKGVFDFKLNEETGFVKTSFIETKENELMSDYVWVTDSCANLELLKEYKQESCKTIFNRLSDFYNMEQIHFDEVIENPQLYKDNPFYDGTQQHGVAHVFNSKTGEIFPYMPKTRLESLGRYLQRAVELIQDGFDGKEYGYKNNEEIPVSVINSISNIVAYLKAINYPSARSCGNWEEQTFVNSLTSDTAIINKGLRDLLNFIYKDTKNSNIIKFRKRLYDSRYGKNFEDKSSLFNLLKDGEKRVQQVPFEETNKGSFNSTLDPWLSERVLNREYDAALSYVIQTERLKDNIYEDVEYKFECLNKMIKALVKPNGMIRFKKDGYLSLDYHQLKNPMFNNKQQNEAEWFLVSEVANSYCSIANELIDNIETKGNITEKDKMLLKKALDGATEYINRSYARITQGSSIKSNGYRCPAYKVPEAYEAVTTEDGIKYVPGAHPLTWAASSLHNASKNYISLLEKIGLLNLLI